MCKPNNCAIRKSNITLGLIGESGIHLCINWLNTLLFKHKSS
jgi:hypothetical protein